jgi:hypothetical protein
MKVQTSSNQPSSSSNIDEETALDRLENSLLSEVSSVVVSDDVSNDTTIDSSIIGTAIVNNKQTKKEKNKKEKHTCEVSICLNPKSKKADYVMTPCKHEFCCSCLLKHITSAKTCPLCRHNIVDNCIDTFQPIRIRQAVNVAKQTIESYDFEAEYNAMAAFNDRNILNSLVKTVSVDCIRNVLQVQRDMNYSIETNDQFVNNMGSGIGREI